MLHLRQALRQLRKSPGFTTVALLTLALGIGANTTLFSVVNALLLRPLPFIDADRLVYAGEWSEQVPNMSVSLPNYQDFRERQKAFTHLGAFRNQSFNFSPSNGDPVRLPGAMISADFLPALGVQPARGRGFTAADDAAGAERTAVVSDDFWQNRLGGAPDVLGTVIHLSGTPYTVIGVMPPGFAYPQTLTEVWIPVGLWSEAYADRGSHPGIYMIGAMRPGVTLTQATDDLKTIAAQLAAEYPDTNARQSATVTLLRDRLIGQARPAIYTLFAAVGFVLLIACANLANLLLARGSTRTQELAVRSALGARRWTLICHFLAESILLGIGGGLLGLVVAHWGIDLLKAALPAGTPSLENIRIDFTVLGFAMLAGLGTSLVFGLVPGFTLSRVDIRADLSGLRRGHGARGYRARATLVVAEFALTLVLLCGTTVMLRSLHAMLREDPGFATSRLLTFNWVLPSTAYPDEISKREAASRALETVGEIPGIETTAVASILPVSGRGSQTSFRIVGGPAFGPGEAPSTEYAAVSPGYFAALQIPVVRGRAFDERDTAQSTRVVIVDTTLVERFFPEEDPLGQHINLGGEGDSADIYEIVGVAGHIQNYGIGVDTRYQSYFPIAQNPTGSISFLLSVPGDTAQAALLSEVRRRLRQVDPHLPIFGERWLASMFDDTIAVPRLTVILLAMFGGLALLLALIGFTGLLSYTITRRSWELGLRMALGATMRDILTLVLAGAGRLIGFGLVLGLAGSLVLVQLLRNQVYGVSVYDPLAFVVATSLLCTTGLLAAWWPAHRATRINPVDALRAE